MTTPNQPALAIFLPALYKKIIDSRSLTCIHYDIDDALSHPDLTSGLRDILKHLSESNSLDEIWATCHEQQALLIREWLNSKQRMALQQRSRTLS